MKTDISKFDEIMERKSFTLDDSFQNLQPDLVHNIPNESIKSTGKKDKLWLTDK